MPPREIVTTPCTTSPATELFFCRSPKRCCQVRAYRFDSALRDRTFMLVDEERQLMLTRVFLDYNAVITDFKLADGTPGVAAERSVA
jgi:hypothetical protein